MKSRRWLFSYFLPFSGILLFLLLPSRTSAGVRDGLRICGQLLVPALFPVSVLSSCILQMGACTREGGLTEYLLFRIFGFSGGCAAPLLLGLLGGFPLGAHLTAAAYEQKTISDEEALRLAPLCNCAGPAFLIGTVASVLGSPGIGVLLWGIQFFSGALICLLFKPKECRSVNVLPMRRTSVGFFAALPQAIEQSALAMLRLTGAVCFFQALFCCAASVTQDLRLTPTTEALLSGTLELTAGIQALRAAALPAAFPLAAALVSWGGFCVHLQAAAALGRAGLPMGPYLLRKLLQAVLAALLAALYPLGKGALAALLFVSGMLSFAIFFLFFKNCHWKKGKAVI